MRFELDHRTGMMRPKKNEEIYFAQSQGGGLIVDDNKNNIKYIIERDGRITKLFGSFDKDNLNLYDMRDARIIADRVIRLLGKGHKYTDFHYFLKGYRMSESFIKTCSDFLGESIWSDMQDRSAGDTVRQEDISEEDKKEIDYIFNGFAYLIVFTYYEPTIDDFIKMMKEAHLDKDNSKYIACVKLNWDKKYKDELDKKIQYYKTYIDKKINRYLNHFVAQIVYCEKYNVSLIDIKKCADEVYKNGGVPLEMSSGGEIDVNESWYDIFKKYVDENWNDVKKRINDFIVEENQKIAKTGFKKTPGKKICDILDEWWYSLGDEKEDIAWDELVERA